MTSKNGISTWKPASSVPAYFPRRSTTKALCCGTTTAVLATTTSARNASTTTTTSIGVITISRAPRLLGPHPQRQPVHLLDPRPLPPLHRLTRPRAHAPGRPAQLRLADPTRGQVLRQYRSLADERVDRRQRLLARLHPL